MTDPRIEQKAREVAEELLPYLKNGWVRPDVARVIAAALQSAVAEEREECCKDTCAQCREGKIPATESALGTQRFWHGDLFCQASAIRARGQKETA